MGDDMFDSLGIDTSIDNDVKKEATDNGIDIQFGIENKTEIKKAIQVKEANRYVAVTEGLVPKAHKDAKFDENRIVENIKDLYTRTNGLYLTYKLDEYVGICSSILMTIKAGRIPNKSYLIGAPKGFEKTSFVNECIITMRSAGFSAVPYISLWELAQIRTGNEQKISKPRGNYIVDNDETVYIRDDDMCIEPTKKPKIVTGMYSYSEYINSDCLFVHLTDVVSKDIESHTLYQLLSIRGAKCLPTIVMMSTSLKPYLNDETLREQVWNDILVGRQLDDCYGRLYHVSCYRFKNISGEKLADNVDKTTGIVMKGV